MGGDVGVRGTQPILDAQHRPTLSSFALSNVLLAFDYDGTLAPIAPTPERARMRRRTRRLLSTTATLYPCVVISGRARDDIAQRLSGIPVWHIFGNHGLESDSVPAPPTAQTRLWVQRLNHDLAAFEGVVVEDKGLTVTVHYRRAADRPQAVAAIQTAIRGLPGVRIVDGSEAVNLLPLGGANKGIALRDALRRFACQTAIYVGDDATDEDVFANIGVDHVLGIRVGAAIMSAAGYHVESQEAVDTLLEALIEIRKATIPSDGGTGTTRRQTSLTWRPERGRAR
jgi:trehalose 6-phosphate phosphatase